MAWLRSITAFFMVGAFAHGVIAEEDLNRDAARAFFDRLNAHPYCGNQNAVPGLKLLPQSVQSNFRDEVAQPLRAPIAVRQLSEADLLKIERQCRRKVEQNSSDWRYYLNLGVVEYQRRAFEKAASLFSQANLKYTQRPKDALADIRAESAIHYNWANALYQTQHFEAATNHYKLALTLIPSDPDARANLAMSEQKIQEEREELRELISGAAKADIPVETGIDQLKKETTAESIQKIVSEVAADIENPGLREELLQILAQANAKGEIPKIEAALREIEAQAEAQSSQIDEIQKKIAALRQKEQEEKKARLELEGKLKEQDQYLREISKTWKSVPRALKDIRDSLNGNTHATDTKKLPSALEQLQLGATKEELYDKNVAFSVSPPLPGLYSTRIFSDYDKGPGVWKDFSNRAHVIQNPNSNHHSANVHTVFGRVKLNESNDASKRLLPLAKLTGYEIDPDSFQFDLDAGAKVTSYTVLENNLGTVSLFVTGSGADSVRFSYRLRLIGEQSAKSDAPAKVESSDLEDFSGTLPAVLEERLKRLNKAAKNDGERATNLEGFVLSKALYTTEDLHVDAYLNRRPVDETKFSRMLKIFLQSPDLPLGVQGKGMDCDCWAEFYIGLARHLKIPTRLATGHLLNDASHSLLTKKNGHGWVRAFDGSSHRWVDLNPTPSKEGLNDDQKLASELALAKLQLGQIQEVREKLETKLRNAKYPPDPQVTAKNYRDKLQVRINRWAQKFNALNDDYGKEPSEENQLRIDEFRNFTRTVLDETFEGVRVALHTFPEIEKEFLDFELGILEFMLPTFATAEQATLYREYISRISAVYAHNSSKPPLYEIKASVEKHGLVVVGSHLYLKSRDQFALKDLKSGMDRPSEIERASLSENGRHYVFHTSPWSFIVDGRRTSFTPTPGTFLKRLDIDNEGHWYLEESNDKLYRDGIEQGPAGFVLKERGFWDGYPWFVFQKNDECKITYRSNELTTTLPKEYSFLSLSDHDRMAGWLDGLILMANKGGYSLSGPTSGNFFVAAKSGGDLKLYDMSSLPAKEISLSDTRAQLRPGPMQGRSPLLGVGTFLTEIDSWGERHPNLDRSIDPGSVLRRFDFGEYRYDFREERYKRDLTGKDHRVLVVYKNSKVLLIRDGIEFGEFSVSMYPNLVPLIEGYMPIARSAAQNLISWDEWQKSPQKLALEAAYDLNFAVSHDGSVVISSIYQKGDEPRMTHAYWNHSDLGKKETFSLKFENKVGSIDLKIQDATSAPKWSLQTFSDFTSAEAARDLDLLLLLPEDVFTERAEKILAQPERKESELRFLVRNLLFHSGDRAIPPQLQNLRRQAASHLPEIMALDISADQKRDIYKLLREYLPQKDW